MSKVSYIGLEAALANLFKTDAGKNASWIALPGGSHLFSEGEESDHLYLVQTGRLGVFRYNEDGEVLTLLGIIKPGEPVGEMSLIAETCHTSTVIALRDTELLALPKADFLRAIEAVPDVLLALSRKMILRAREGHNDHSTPSVFAFFSVCDTKIRPLIDNIAKAITEQGYRAQVLDKSWHGSTSDELSRVEERNDYVLYVGELNDTHWNSLAARQVDHTFLVGDARHTIPEKLDWSLDPMGVHRPSDLILLHEQETISSRTICHTKAWLDALNVARWFHICPDNNVYHQRLARILTGHSVGLVCSGGGARAYTHIGAIQALRDAHVPFDFLCGSSMGGIVAATVGLDWTQSEIDEHIRAAFVVSSPLDDIALPLVAMTHGTKVDARLKEHFGEILIEDMPLPFFCISSNLTTGEIKTHKTGRLREALRASISLPGIMPPVIQDGHVLVDGAVMRSFPTGMMRMKHFGSVVGIDVTRAHGLDPESIKMPKNLSHWIFSGGWRQGPPIVSILMRSATVTTTAELASSRKATDLLIIPEPEGVEIRDWHAYDEAVECGYQTTVEALAKIEIPVSQLRKKGITHHPLVPIFTPDDRRKREQNKSIATQKK